jgi:hypothetical protein
MHKDHICSLQYHKVKTKAVYFLNGNLEVYVGKSMLFGLSK